MKTTFPTLTKDVFAFCPSSVFYCSQRKAKSQQLFCHGPDAGIPLAQTIIPLTQSISLAQPIAQHTPTAQHIPHA